MVPSSREVTYVVSASIVQSLCSNIGVYPRENAANTTPPLSLISQAHSLHCTADQRKNRMFDDETALIPSLRGGEAADIVSKVCEGEEAAIEESLAVLEDGTSEDEKERVSKVSANL